jgi:hypothetical protein
MPSIFVCYRREDTAPYAGRLHDRLVPVFGREHVFVDIDALAPGVDFEAEIRKTLSQIDVMLVVVGRHWIDLRDEAGGRRIDNPDDYVRREIATALENGVSVIPVLVGGARPPRADTLPEEIRGLARRQAIELTDTRWEYDTGKLNESLRRIQSRATAPAGSTGTNSTAPLGREVPRPFPPRSDGRLVGRPINLGFDGAVVDGIPHGWFNSVDYVWRVSDRYEARAVPRNDGKAGLCLMFSDQKATNEEFGSMMQRFPAAFLASRTVQFDGELKTENVTGWAGLWLRADGEEIPNLVFDNMQNLALRGTQAGWSRYSLQANLPDETKWLNIGIVLSGSGTIWADDLHFRVWHSDGFWEDL